MYSMEQFDIAMQYFVNERHPIRVIVRAGM